MLRGASTFSPAFVPASGADVLPYAAVNDSPLRRAAQSMNYFKKETEESKNSSLAREKKNYRRKQILQRDKKKGWTGKGITRSIKQKRNSISN